MSEDVNRKLFWAIVADPFGIVGFVLMLMGIINVFLYGTNLPESPERWNYWIAWIYPLFLILMGIPFLLFAVYRLKSKSRKFLKEIWDESKKLKKELKNIDDSLKNSPNIPNSSEFGISTLDLEILETVKESGGFIPILMRDLWDLPFSYDSVKKSMAKLWLMDYIYIPEKISMKITLSPHGLDILELPKLTFTTKVPEDVGLMIAYANMLYREGKYQETILKCYNILERALKVHLIPSIPDYKEKWKIKVESKYGKNTKGIDQMMWKGVPTKASLNDLWNFYKKNIEIGRKWSELIDRTVKYSSKYTQLINELDKESIRLTDKSIDTIADVRSSYAHDKPKTKYEKDAYRTLKLTEIALGLMFETMKTETLGKVQSETF